MAITLSEFPTDFPFPTSTRAVNNAFPTDDSFPNMPPEFSSLPSTVSSVFDAALSAQKSGLSTGATVGISIGAAVAGLIIIGLIILLWRRGLRTSRSNSHSSEEKAITPSESSPGATSLDSASPEGNRQTEIDGEVVHEVQGAREPHKPYEADHTHTRAEMDAGWRGWEAPAHVETDLSRNVPHLRGTGAGALTCDEPHTQHTSDSRIPVIRPT